MIRVVDVDLDAVDGGAAIEIGLPLGQRHEHHPEVIIRHADLEYGRGIVGLDARRRAERRHRTARRDQRHAIACPHRELVGEPAADHDALAFVEALERALADIAGDRPEPDEVLGAHAVHQDAVRFVRRGRKRLADHQRCRQGHAGNLRNPVRHRIPIVERGFERLDQHVAIKAEDLVEQLLAKAVHHCEHDDERGYAQQDADEGEAGNDRDESFLAPRPQVAQRQHPFET